MIGFCYLPADVAVAPTPELTMLALLFLLPLILGIVVGAIILLVVLIKRKNRQSRNIPQDAYYYPQNTASPAAPPYQNDHDDHGDTMSMTPQKGRFR